MTVTINEINFAELAHIEAIAGLWTGACGPNLATSTRAVKYNLRSLASTATSGNFGVFAWQGEEPVGVVLVESADEMGWVSLLAVLPETQRQGIGLLLLAWAEDALRARGCQTVQIGGSINSFVCGLPTELGPTELDTGQFFARAGYGASDSVWDVAVNLAAYQSPLEVAEVAGAVRSAQPNQLDAMQVFAKSEMSSWDGEVFARFVADFQAADRLERLSDYMILWTERGIDGLCRLNFEDSYRPIERVYPFQLPRPWGAIDQICVSADLGEQGFEGALIDAGLRRLHNNGVNGCIIHASARADRFAEFGFQPSREYIVYKKRLK